MIQSTTLDKIGLFLSGVCLLHCLITPIVVTLIPILSLSLSIEHIMFHTIMLWLVVPTSCIALFLGCRKHKKASIVIIGAAGMLVLISVALFGHDLYGHDNEKVVTTIGGLIIAFSHYLNYRACQSIVCPSNHCATHHRTTTSLSNNISTKYSYPI